MLVINADELPLFMACNGARLMPRAVPESESDPSLRNEGIAAHYMAQKAFEGSGTLETLTGQKAPNGVFLTPEMAGHCAIYLSAIQPGEMEVDTTHGNVHYQVNGRVDHICYRQNENTLYVDDFKYGWGLVEPYMNWTLISHAYGHCVKHQIRPDKIVLSIHQPRPHHPDGKNRSWIISFADLMAHADALIGNLCKPSNILSTGPQCRKCPANALCAAAQSAGMNAIDISEIPLVDELSDEMLSYELIKMKHANITIENRIKSLEELTKYRLKNSHVIKDFALEHQYTNVMWKDYVNPEMIKALCGVDISKPATITPAQAKLAGVPDYIIGSMTERRQTGVKLVQIDVNKRASKILKKDK